MSGVPQQYLSSYGDELKDEAEGLTLADLASSLKRHRIFILVCALLAVCCVGVYSILRQPVYVASATIRIDPYRAGSLGVSDTNTAIAPDQTEVIHTEVAVIKSDSVALRTLNALTDEEFRQVTGASRNTIALPASVASLNQHQSAVLQNFEAHTEIKLVEGTQLVSLGVHAQSAVLAAAIANHLVEAYQEQSSVSRDDSVQNLQRGLDKQIQDLRAQIAASQQKLASFQEENSILGTPSSSTTVIDTLKALNDRVSTANADRVTKEAQFEAAEKSSPATLAALYPNQGLGELQAQQASLYAKYAQLSAKFGPGYPPLQQIKTELDQLNTHVTVEANAIRGRVRNEYLAAKSMEQTLRQEYDQQTATAYKANRKGAEYDIRTSEVSSGRERLDALQKKLQQAITDNEINGVNVILVDPARPVFQPVGPSKSLLFLSALIVGLFAGSAAAFAREALSDRVTGSEKAQNAVGLPVVAVMHGGASSKEGLTMFPTNSKEADSYRSLRNQVLGAINIDRPASLLITSTLPETSANCALNLSISLANAGRKTLLVDADFEKSQLQKLSQSSNGAGLSELLAGEDAAFAQLPSGEGKLFLLTAGSRMMNANDEIASVQFESLFEKWTTDFECLVFLGAPVLDSSTSQILAKHVQQVLLIEREGTSKLKALRLAKQTLRRAGAHVIGLVLSTDGQTVGA